jgi:CBS domain containing-hemolysin-like protein
VRAVGVEPVENVEGGGQDAATLRHLVEHSANVGALEASYRAQISGVIELETLTVDALVPAQGHPTSVPATATAADVRAASARSGHLRILVQNGSVVPKVVHVRDTLLEPDDRPAGELARPGFVLASGTTVHAALARMRESSEQLAIVMDGERFVGVVTLADVLRRILPSPEEPAPVLVG